MLTLLICTVCGRGHLAVATRADTTATCTACGRSLDINIDAESRGVVATVVLTVVAESPEELDAYVADLGTPECSECGESVDTSDPHAGYGMCASCLHDAIRSGWTPEVTRADRVEVVEVRTERPRIVLSDDGIPLVDLGPTLVLARFEQDLTDVDTSSSASRQHFIDTGSYLEKGADQ